MKNLLIWVSDRKQFSREARVLVKVQIDNALRLGQDLILVTNFSYGYNGVKAVLTKDENYCAVRPRSNNTSIIPALVEEGIIQDGIYWNHDMDAFQLHPIEDAELELDDYGVGLTDYGWRPRLCMGSYFVKASSKDIFERARKIIFTDVEDEDAVAELLEFPEIARRCKMMNITYNLGMRRIPQNVERATKPVKIAHFHPSIPGLLDAFRPLLPDDFIKILADHGHS